MCPRSWAAATPVKYKRYIQQLTYVPRIVKNSENNGTEEISLVPPPQDWLEWKSPKMLPLWSKAA